MGPKIDLNLHAKSLKRPILGAQLRVLKPPKKLQLTLLKAPPIEPTCLIYANWGRGKKLKHGVPKKKERWQKNQREPQNLGFLSLKTKREPQIWVFSVKKPKDSRFFEVFWENLWILPPQCLNPEAQKPGGLNLHAWNHFFAETSVLFFGIQFWTIIAKTKILGNFTP